MKINFDQVLKELDGSNITELKNPRTATREKPEGDGAFIPVTLKALCVRAITTPLQTDANISGEDAFKRLELARKINAGGEQELDPADAVLIRDRAAKLFSIVASGQVYEMLKG